MRPLAAATTACLLLALGVSAGCDSAVTEPEADGPTTSQADLDGKADGTSTSELRVRAGQMTVWLTARAVADATDHGPRIVVSGRASRDLESTFSWIPDDAYAEATIVSTRKFELVLREPYEVATLLSGAPIFITIRPKTGEVRDYYLRLTLAPRLVDFSGSTRLWLRDAVDPIYVRDGRQNVRYRGLVTARTAPSAVTVTAGGAPLVAALDGKSASFDWSPDALVAALVGADALEVHATLGGKDEVKRATLAPMVASVALSTDDPYGSLITPASCADATRACIAAHSGADDLAACGLARDVATCLAAGPICGAASPAPALLEVAAPELAEPIAAFAAACPAGEACDLGPIAFYRLPECLAATPDLDAVVGLAFGSATTGLAMTRDGLLARAPFATVGADAAGRLLGWLDNWAASHAASYWIEASGHAAIAYYAPVRRAFVLTLTP